MRNKSTFASFLRINWMPIATVLGLGVGVVGIAISIYLYDPATRQPRVLDDPDRIPIIKSDLFPHSSLKVTTPENVVVNGDVTVMKVYFWNAGNQSIKPENILDPPLRLSLNDPDARILDCKMVKISRRQTNINVQRSQELPSNELLVTFSILEQNDGVGCQIIYEGNPSAEPVVIGSIEGVPSGVENIRRANTMARGRFWGEMLRLLPIYLILMTSIIVIKIVLNKLDLRRSSRSDNQTLVQPARRGKVVHALSYVVVGIITLLLVFFCFIVVPMELARTNLMKEVPPNIKF
jgi:hypothetical protein